ncbi:MAG: hypothetical protein ACI8XO_002827 [Verrucomicrobiales bacterium]|jgi:hypothetical protein
MARNLTVSGGFLDGASHLLVDRDNKFLPLRTYLEGMTDTDVVLVPKYSETRLQENLLKFKLLRARQKPYLGARMVQLISRSAKPP